MDSLNALKIRWTDKSLRDARTQARIWDGVAEEFCAHEPPDYETNGFLKLLETFASPAPHMSVLDIGCGCGGYTLALAKRVGSAQGVDISPKMLGHARARAEIMNLGNAEFRCMDWAQADIDALGFRRRFDIVFAHMTPAISDFDTFDKLNACSRKYCLMSKPARRRDRIQDRAFEIVGIGGGREHDDGIVHAFEYLWYSGLRPQLVYSDEVWESARSADAMAAWCIDRARLLRQLSPAEEDAMRAYVAGLAVDGIVRETVTTTVVTMYWQV